jgi:hypothetical protein|tara:strand:- start:318 stop:551 length:234 start_codon:yes stop_codon:yes gene_type:complete
MDRGTTFISNSGRDLTNLKYQDIEILSNGHIKLINATDTKIAELEKLIREQPFKEHLEIDKLSTIEDIKNYLKKKFN